MTWLDRFCPLPSVLPQNQIPKKPTQYINISISAETIIFIHYKHKSFSPTVVGKAVVVYIC